MESVFIIIVILATGWGLCRAAIFNEELYLRSLDPDLCARQLEVMDRSQFYDASFRVPKELLRGHYDDYGNFHQCLAINQEFPGTNIEGKYCVIRARLSPPIVRIPLLGGVSDSDNLTWAELTLDHSRVDTESLAPVFLELGVCVPRACAADALLRRYADHPHLRFQYTVAHCRLPDDKPLDLADYIAIFFLSVRLIDCCRNNL